MMTEKNKVICIDDTDENLGAATTDKSDVIGECRRQLYNYSTCFILSEDAKNDLIRNTKFQLRAIVEKHFYKGNCSFNSFVHICFNFTYVLIILPSPATFRARNQGSRPSQTFQKKLVQAKIGNNS